MRERTSRSIGWVLAVGLCLGHTASSGLEAAAIDEAALLRDIRGRQIGADPGTVANVTFRDLASQARCGRTLVVADPAAAGSLTINAACTRASPLVIKARERLAPVITGQVTINGDFVKFEGFRLNGGNIVVRGNSNRVTRNLVSRPREIGIQVEAGPRGGSYNQIDHNEVTGFAAQAVEVCLGRFIAGPKGPIPTCTGGRAADGRYNWIHGNYIHDASGARPGNGHEAIRILTDSYGDTFALIERNLMTAVFVSGEPEAISIKSNGNVVRLNTLDSARSEITLRLGNGNLVHSNYLVRGDIKVKGDRNEVYRNRLLNGAVNVDAGNATMDNPRCRIDPTPCTPDGKAVRPAARQSSVRDNLVARGVIVSGREQTGFTVPAQRNTFLRNTPAVTRQLDDGAGTVVQGGRPVGVTSTRLGPGDVGVRSGP